MQLEAITRFLFYVRRRVRTVDPVVLGDVRTYVVLVGRRAEGACEGRVLAQEVGGRTCVQVLICRGRGRERERKNHGVLL